jgi:ATP-dependent Lon protease
MQDLHDRSIMTDNGWKVLLGRGLDVFERANGRFNVAEFDQRKRKWKNCEITFIRI